MVLYYGYHKSKKFRAKIECIFTLHAVHAYKQLSPSCDIQEDAGTGALVTAYRASRCMVLVSVQADRHLTIRVTTVFKRGIKKWKVFYIILFMFTWDPTNFPIFTVNCKITLINGGLSLVINYYIIGKIYICFLSKR